MPIGLMRIRHTSLSEFRLYCKYLKLWGLINLDDAFLFLCTIVMAVLKDELFLLCHVVAYNSCLLCFLKCILIIIVRRV